MPDEISDILPKRDKKQSPDINELDETWRNKNLEVYPYGQ
jgi:hypothetical protein